MTLILTYPHSERFWKRAKPYHYDIERTSVPRDERDTDYEVRIYKDGRYLGFFPTSHSHDEAARGAAFEMFLQYLQHERHVNFGRWGMIRDGVEWIDLESELGPYIGRKAREKNYHTYLERDDKTFYHVVERNLHEVARVVIQATTKQEALDIASADYVRFILFGEEIQGVYHEDEWK